MAHIRTQHIAQAIYEATEDKHGKELDVLLEHATQFISSRHLMSKSQDILRELENIIDTKNQTVRVKIESATPLTKKTLEELENTLQKRYDVKHVILEYTENKDHIGGIKITVGEEVIDLTLKNTLNQLENYLIAH
ncbi:MAG: F0F1 ATP synthase subunit delta [Candidatus Pacebacteria bacterium]|jgi:ATP synthase F1 delta subunit|nr:F0F1 ATP synthase subunit delta [Candidatus Paceibacterota bacterium]